jgi:hypothetical protein
MLVIISCLLIASVFVPNTAHVALKKGMVFHDPALDDSLVQLCYMLSDLENNRMYMYIVVRARQRPPREHCGLL